MVVDVVIMVDLDKFFGCYLVVLGNIGSGKFCLVVGLIRWLLEVVSKVKFDVGGEGCLNVWFIVLDFNGEYMKVFQDMEGVWVFCFGDLDMFLQIFVWFWNSYEWVVVLYVQLGIQWFLFNQVLCNL